MENHKVIGQRVVRSDYLAKVTGRTKSFYARQAILQHLDELEDRYVAEQRLTDLKAGRSASASLGDVLNRYGMDDRD